MPELFTWNPRKFLDIIFISIGVQKKMQKRLLRKQTETIPQSYEPRDELRNSMPNCGICFYLLFKIENQF